MTDPLLCLKDLRVTFDVLGGQLPAVRGVDLQIAPGETLALVGESGSGKSALARGLLRINQPAFTRQRSHVTGSAVIDCGDGDGPLDLVTATEAQLRRVRAGLVSMVFQDAMSALNPVMRIGTQVVEALKAASPGLADAAARDRALAILAEVGLPDPARRARQYPHQLSGGQRQRVMIAIAVSRAPRLLIADEPTTALDVTVQARILALIKGLQRRSGMAMLFITHDLGVVAQIADRVAVMYAGQIVELRPVAEIFAAPGHPYTRGLLDSRPGFRRPGQGLRGTAPSPQALPSGCAFRPRCPLGDAGCSLPPPLAGGIRCTRPPA